MILDRAHFRVVLSGQEITLSPKTFVALCYLAERAGQLVARAEFDQALKTRGRIDQVIHNLEQALPGRVVSDATGVRLMLDPVHIQFVGRFAGEDDDED